MTSTILTVIPDDSTVCDLTKIEAPTPRVWQNFLPLSGKSLRDTLLLAGVYYLSGLVGLMMQSAQTGVSPFWPASGVAIAAFIIYGIHLWPAIFLGMFALGVTLDLPVMVTFIASVGSVMEALIPLLVLRRNGFNGAIQQMRQLLYFFLIAGTGPIFSAALGTASMHMAPVNLLIPTTNIFLTWWLGNSFGIALVGGALLALHQCIGAGQCGRINRSLALISAALAGTISVFAFLDLSHLSSALMLNLMIPLVILSSIRIGFAGTLVPVSASVLVMLLMSSSFPSHSIHQYPLGIIYLDIVQLWIITLTGLLVSVAHKEGMRHARSLWMSSHDSLTSLRNRYHLEHQLQQMCQGLRVSDRTFTLLFLDLNKFKEVNDKAGHLVGDAGLAFVADILRASARDTDTVARWGGDEFIILLPECKEQTATHLAQTINDQLSANPFVANELSFSLSFSIGVAESRKGESPAQLIERADQASYRAKTSGTGIQLA